MSSSRTQIGSRADEALVQDLDPRAFDEAHLQQAPLEFGGGQTTGGRSRLDIGDHAGEAPAAIGKRHHLVASGQNGNISVTVGH